MNLKRLASGVSIAAIMTCVCANGALAQTVDNDDDTARRLGAVTVTATKRAEDVQDVPVSVTAITAETIEKLGVVETGDITRIAPSLTVTQSNNKTNSAFSVRGIGTNLFGIGIEQSVAMIVDDVAMVQQGQSIANLVDIERIEVLRGPQSTLFGKAASAGVINVTTKGPSDTFEGLIDAQITDDDYYRVLGSVSGPITDSASFRLTGFYSDHEGWIDNLTEGQPDLGAEESMGIRGKLFLSLSDSADLEVTAYKTEEESQCCGRVIGEFDPSGLLFGQIPFPLLTMGITGNAENRSVRVDSPPDSTNDSQGISAKLSVDLGGFEFVSISAYDEWFYTNTEDVDFGDLDLLGLLTMGALSGGFFSDSVRDNTFYSQEFRLVSPSYENFDYLLGLYYANTEIDRSFFRNVPIAPSNFTAKATNENYSAFGQANFQVTDQTEVSVGLRYLSEEIGGEYQELAAPNVPLALGSDSEDTVMGKISVQHDLSEDVMVFASYARGHKGQAFDITSGTTQADFANPVGAETSDAFEIGLKGLFLDNRLRLNATAFHTTYDDFQVQAIDSTGAVIEFNIDNVGQLVTQGVEIESETILTDELSLLLNAAYTDAVVNDYIGAQCFPGQTMAQGCIGGVQTVDGGVLPNAPELKFTAALDFVKTLDNLPFDIFANGSYVWQDEVNFSVEQNPLTVEGSYGIANLRIGVTDKDDRYELSGFVNNLFDESYRGQINDFSIVSTASVLIHNSPRNAQRYAGAQLKLRF